MTDSNFFICFVVFFNKLFLGALSIFINFYTQNFASPIVVSSELKLLLYFEFGVAQLS